jgi:hypothetical protein
VQIVMAAMDDNGSLVVPPFVQRFRPTYPLGWIDRFEALNFLQVPVMMPGYVPKMAFIDREGVVRSQYGGEQPFFKNTAASVRDELDKLLKAAQPARKAPARKKK